MPVSTPIRLETDRLILDGHARADFEPLAQMWADPAIYTQIRATPSSRQESWMRLLRYQGLWPVLGFGYWAIRRKTDNRYVGDIGFADFCRDLSPSIEGIPEAGWVLASWAHGQGYGSEALAAALGWLDQQEGLERSACLIAPDNAASLALARKSGYGGAQSATLGQDGLMVLWRQRAAG